MSSVHEIKLQEVLPTPLLLLECTFRDGHVERWSTHAAELEGSHYEPRVLEHNQFEMRLGAEEGIDTAARFAVTLANTDSRFSQIERTKGWKGAQLKVRFVFYDLDSNQAVTEPVAVFLGIASPPEEITEKTIRVQFVNRLSLQRVTLPAVRIQARCPWLFPANAGQRAEAVEGGTSGVYSKFHACGYSADQEGGCGNLAPDGEPYTSCNYTKSDCQARGMYATDSAGRPTARFGGFPFLPPTVLVRPHGAKEQRTSDGVDNRAQTNDVAPMIYGTAWVQPPVVFTRNDGNLTHCEVLLGIGPMERVHKVLVNGVEIPLGVTGRDMTATGWYNVVSLGTRNGGFNLNFRDQNGAPLGDPHGSIGILAVAVPNRLNDGRTAPRVEALVDGLRLARFDLEGNALEAEFTRNPAWVLLDLLRRSGWRLEEIDVRSFARAAQRCDTVITAKDGNGNAVQTRLFECNLAVTSRRSAAELVRGVRLASAMLLTFNADGKLELRPETAMAGQQPVKPASSNSTEPWNGGWPAFEFGDGANGTTGILRRPNGEPSLRWRSRGIGECANRLSVEFQNAFNEYQQDGVSLVDHDDVEAAGHELSAALPALGLPNLDQAARVTRFHLMKGLQGNEYAEFETSVEALGLRPGDLITLTYLKDGVERAAYRILKIAPSANYESVRITAQRHLEGWYGLLEGAGAAEPGRVRLTGRQGGVPRPLPGYQMNAEGEQEFLVEESLAGGDEAETVQLRVRFRPPARPAGIDLGIPILGLSPEIEPTGGSLAGGGTWYYAISAVDAQGRESELSFTVRASIPAATNTNRVILTGISLPLEAAGMRVYRGESPQQLMLIGGTNERSATFEDAGLAAELAPPPDPNYDHAAFYWRMELMPEVQATLHGPDFVGHASLSMLEHEYRGATVRIVRGPGKGQERVVLDNTADRLILKTPWNVLPDASSYFTVSETGWRTAGATRGEEITFDVTNRPGTVVQISGRSANATGQETPGELSVLHRRLLGSGDGAGSVDRGIPPAPVFALSAGRRGQIQLLGIGFETLENTRGIMAGTLVLWYWDELDGPSTMTLAEAASGSADAIRLAGPGQPAAGSVIQAGRELFEVNEILPDGALAVVRGSYGSVAEPHPAGERTWLLRKKAIVAPFPRGFFGSPSSGAYLQNIAMPNARIAAAAFSVTNSFGDSPARVQCYTALTGGGLRTLAGGQYCIQVPGAPALESAAAPPLVMDQTQALGDVFATLAEAPTGGALRLRLRVDGAPYCELSFQDGERFSNAISGTALPPIAAGSEVSLDVIEVPVGENTRPGRDLTVTLRV